MSDDPPTEATTRVCPRCGEPAGQQEYCLTCGLHLADQDELPTRETWAHREAPPLVPGQQSASHASFSVSADPQSPRPLNPSMKQRWRKVSTGARMVIGAAALIPALITLSVALPDNSPDGSAAAADVVRMEEALASAGGLDFLQLFEAYDPECQVGPASADAEGATYDCSWEDQDGNVQSETWMFVDEDKLGRITHGGEEPAPPVGADESSERVNRVIQGRLNQVEDPVGGSQAEMTCVPAPDRNINGKRIGQPRTYDCTAFGPGGRLILQWRWHGNGTVAAERLHPYRFVPNGASMPPDSP